MPGSALAPLLSLAASMAAVPQPEAICERLFKAGGQVLIVRACDSGGTVQVVVDVQLGKARRVAAQGPGAPPGPRESPARFFV